MSTSLDAALPPSKKPDDASTKLAELVALYKAGRITLEGYIEDFRKVCSCPRLFTDVWTSCSNDPHVTPVVYPLLSTSTFDAFFEDCVIWAAKLELIAQNLLVLDEVPSSPNFLLHGPKGVGKSTLLQNFASVLQIVTSKVIPVLFDYEKSNWTTPLAMMKRAIGEETNDDDVGDVQPFVASAIDRGYAFIVLMDEVQALYLPTADERHRLSVCIVYQLLQLGKCNGVFVVVTGSSQRTPYIALKLYLAEAGLSSLAAPYASLNNTVFLLAVLSPLRTLPDITKNMRRLKWDVDRAKFFYHSGGVFRRNNSRALWVSETVLEENLLSPVMRALLTRFVHLNQLISLDTDGKTSLEVARVEELRTNPWSLLALRQDEVLEIIRMFSTATDPSPLYQLLEACDASLLIRERGYVAPASTAFLVQVAETLSMHGNGGIGSVLYSFMLTFQGVEGGSPGSLLEKVLLDEAVKKHRLPGAAMFSHQKLSIRGENGDVLNLIAKDGTSSALTWGSFPHETIIQLAADNGIDGFWIHPQGTVVDLVRVKLGKNSRQITCGGPLSDDPSHDDINLRVIMARLLKRSWPTLKAVFQKLKPDAVPTLGELYLLTNKTVTDKHLTKMHGMNIPFHTVDGQKKRLHVLGKSEVWWLIPEQCKHWMRHNDFEENIPDDA